VASAVKKNQIVGAVVVIAVVVGFALTGSGAKGGGTTYLDPAHRFSVQLPPGVRAQDVPAADRSSETLIFSDGSAGDVQITITPWDTTALLTQASALPQYPLLDGEVTTPISVAAVTGFAFEDSNPQASNVWLASGGYLYQLVGWGNSAALLETITAHWKFL
jgi:hypothetical protein